MIMTYIQSQTINESQNADQFKKTLDNLLAIFNTEIDSITKKRDLFVSGIDITNTKYNIQSSYLASSNDKSINDFVTGDDWEEIDHRVYWSIQSFLDFHKTVIDTTDTIINFLHDNKDLWEKAGTVGELLGLVRESGRTGIPQLDGVIDIGYAVLTLVGKIEVEKRTWEYSKQFVINIFDQLVKIVKSKDITIIKKSFEIAKNTLDAMKIRWSNFLSLVASRSKVNYTLKLINDIYDRAQIEYDNYIRESFWGDGWY